MNATVVRAIALVGGLSLAGCAASSAPPATPTAPAVLAPKEPIRAPPVPEAIRAWFILSGYQPFQADALVAHAKIESGFERCVVAKSGSRYLFQWLGVRLGRLWEYAGHRGCPSLAVQLAFANEELYHQPAFACFWRARTQATALAALRRGFGRGHC